MRPEPALMLSLDAFPGMAIATAAKPLFRQLCRSCSINVATQRGNNKKSASIATVPVFTTMLGHRGPGMHPANNLLFLALSSCNCSIFVFVVISTNYFCYISLTIIVLILIVVIVLCLVIVWPAVTCPCIATPLRVAQQRGTTRERERERERVFLNPKVP